MHRCTLLTALTILSLSTACTSSVKGGGGATGSNTSASGTGGSTGTRTTDASSTTTTTGTTASTGMTTASSGTMTGSSTSTGTPSNFGDCNTNADCMPGGTCVAVVQGGFRLCEYPVMPATMPSGSPGDTCTSSAMCTPPQQCFFGPILPVCSPIQMAPHNQCAGPMCMKNADCPNGVCMPAGTYGNEVAACLLAQCTKDTDCTAKTGGHCATVREPCCSDVIGLYCIYPGDCRSNADCPAGHCQINQTTQEPTCVAGAATCPGG